MNFDDEWILSAAVVVRKAMSTSYLRRRYCLHLRPVRNAFSSVFVSGSFRNISFWSLRGRVPEAVDCLFPVFFLSFFVW